MAARTREIIEARWKGHGNERGHWRIVCGVCTAVLGFVQSDPWHWVESFLPSIEQPSDGSARPLPPMPSKAVAEIVLPRVYPDTNYAYRPDRNGYFHLRLRTTRLGEFGQPMPSRGGRFAYPGDVGSWHMTLVDAIVRRDHGEATEGDRELLRHAEAVGIRVPPRHQVIAGDFEKPLIGRDKLERLISTIPARILRSSRGVPLGAQIVCPREKGDAVHRECGRVNIVQMPTFAVLARLNWDGEWLAILRTNDPVLTGPS
jgi:hypothetical protein